MDLTNTISLIGVIASSIGAIATLGLFYFACITYNKWNTQKGAEVIAFEAKEAIKELQENNYLSFSLIHDIEQLDKIDKESVFKYAHQRESLFKRLLFINNCIHLKNLINDIDKYNDTITDMLKIYAMLICENLTEHTEKSLKDDLKNKHEISSKCIDEITLKIKPYALYQASIKFRISS